MFIGRSYFCLISIHVKLCTVASWELWLYFFRNKEILLIATDAMVRPHIAVDVPGRTSINALWSSNATHPLTWLKNAHKENAVQDTLINRSHYVSRCRMVHSTFSIAVIIAAIPNNAHMSCPPRILNWVFWFRNRYGVQLFIDNEIGDYHCKRNR